MTPRKITIWFILSSVAVIVLYDIYAVYVGGLKATISWIIYEEAHNQPMIPFAFGVLMGHFFWQMKKPKEES